MQLQAASGWAMLSMVTRVTENSKDWPQSWRVIFFQFYFQCVFMEKVAWYQYVTEHQEFFFFWKRAKDFETLKMW